MFVSFAWEILLNFSFEIASSLLNNFPLFSRYTFPRAFQVFFIPTFFFPIPPPVFSFFFLHALSPFLRSHFFLPSFHGFPYPFISPLPVYNIPVYTHPLLHPKFFAFSPTLFHFDFSYDPSKLHPYHILSFPDFNFTSLRTIDFQFQIAYFEFQIFISFSDLRNYPLIFGGKSRANFAQISNRHPSSFRLQITLVLETNYFQLSSTSFATLLSATRLEIRGWWPSDSCSRHTCTHTRIQRERERERGCI